MTKVFCNSKDGNIIDAIVLSGNGEIGKYSRMTMAQLAVDHPDVMVDTAENAVSRYEQSMITPPVEITHDDFEYALSVLPPLNWVFNGEGDTESFKMSEFISGNITAIYARIGSSFFKMHDQYLKPHEDIVRLIQQTHNLEELHSGSLKANP